MNRLRESSALVCDASVWCASGELFAVVDACVSPDVPERPELKDPTRAVSLYRGPAEVEMRGVAPYLFMVDEAVLGWITQRLWGDPWGILVRARSTLEVLRTHFRRQLLVETTEGEKLQFRFYDPRVLPRFVRVGNADQLTDFFGPVYCICVTDDETYGLRLFHWDDKHERPPESIRIRMRRPDRPPGTPVPLKSS